MGLRTQPSDDTPLLRFDPEALVASPDLSGPRRQLQLDSGPAGPWLRGPSVDAGMIYVILCHHSGWGII